MASTDLLVEARIDVDTFLTQRIAEKSMSTVEATRELRKHLGDSQQAFANRLGLSIRAVANYESDRTPTGRVLVAMSRLAYKSNRSGLFTVFVSALADELNIQGRLARGYLELVVTSSQ